MPCWRSGRSWASQGDRKPGGPFPELFAGATACMPGFQQGRRVAKEDHRNRPEDLRAVVQGSHLAGAGEGNHPVAEGVHHSRLAVEEVHHKCLVAAEEADPREAHVSKRLQSMRGKKKEKRCRKDVTNISRRSATILLLLRSIWWLVLSIRRLGLTIGSLWS